MQVTRQTQQLAGPRACLVHGPPPGQPLLLRQSAKLEMSCAASFVPILPSSITQARARHHAASTAERTASQHQPQAQNGPAAHSMDSQSCHTPMDACRSGATCIRIASTAELVAVGLHSGEVAVYRLWPAKADAEPLHVIGLGEWGYEPEVTGSVADLHWSPDERVLAVRPCTACVLPGFTARYPGMQRQIMPLIPEACTRLLHLTRESSAALRGSTAVQAHRQPLDRHTRQHPPSTCSSPQDHSCCSNLQKAQCYK